ncbi:hypothetical protein Tco_0797155 [Tanacetum coccineum]
MNDEEENSYDAFLQTPDNYVPTDDETNDVDDEEYIKISEEIFDYVNVKLKDAELNDEDNEDAEMADDEAHTTITAAPATQSATIDVALLSSSHSVSSNYGSIFLNVKNLQSNETEVVSMLDVNVQHEVPSTQTSSLLTIPMTVIPKPSVINPSVIVTTAITLILLPFFPNLQQSTPIPTPTTVKVTTSTLVVLDFESLSVLYLCITNLEKEVKELRSEVPTAIKEYLETSLDDALYKVLKRTNTKFKKELSEQKSDKEVIDELVQAHVINEVKN